MTVVSLRHKQFEDYLLDARSVPKLTYRKLIDLWEVNGHETCQRKLEKTVKNWENSKESQVCSKSAIYTSFNFCPRNLKISCGDNDNLNFLIQFF